MVITTTVRRQVQSLIVSLKVDRGIIGVCQQCGSSAPLAKWNLFYNDEYPKEILPTIQEIQGSVDLAKKEYDDCVAKATNLAEKKSLEVNIGKVVEKVVPALPSFPFHPCDCRTLFDPIDYVVFDGLTKNNRVEQIHFLEVKTGFARLNPHQKQVKSAVENKKIEFQFYEGNHI
jgi:predicted Holliday junction resolvase-like endonuclease